MLRQRHGKHHTSTMTPTADEPAPPAPPTASRRAQWILLALMSGACAALNGVFAKLTTTELTASLAKAVADALRASQYMSVVELVVRGTFFALNLIFNAIMWTLFTKALSRAQSTTQVSILNTSTNFVLTALLGLLVFAEALPPLWWAGAALLVVGNVIVGTKVDDDDQRLIETEPLVKLDDDDENAATTREQGRRTGDVDELVSINDDDDDDEPAPTL